MNLSQRQTAYRSRCDSQPVVAQVGSATAVTAEHSALSFEIAPSVTLDGILQPCSDQLGNVPVGIAQPLEMTDASIERVEDTLRLACNGSPARRRVGIVGRLVEIHMVERMDRSIGADASSCAPVGEIGDGLVRIHVRGRAPASMQNMDLKFAE